MSSKVGYCVFYVAFLSIVIFMSSSMGTSILTDVEASQLTPPLPPTGGTLIDSLTFLFSIAVFGLTTFGFLVQVSTPFTMLFFFIVLPLSFGFLWALLELARGN